MLKGIIFSVENVLLPVGDIAQEVFGEVIKLFDYLNSKNIKVILFTNRQWTLTNKTDGTKTTLENKLKTFRPYIKYYSPTSDPAVPYKPKVIATKYVADQEGLSLNELMYVGNNRDDMITAVNANLLFLCASWYGQANTEYGFNFSTPKEIARFVDLFCLREHFWAGMVASENFEFYTLGTFSTYKQVYEQYSADARDLAKFGYGHPDFWTQNLISSIYFTGLHHRIDYITTYPGHRVDSPVSIMSKPMTTFAACFRARFLPDLLVRHTTAAKSQASRIKGESVNHLNQLNTIKLTKLPTKNQATGEKYKTPLKKGSTVLVIDDFCTEGNSLESARHYLHAAGHNVILMSWLKTINRGFIRLLPLTLEPYKQNIVTESPVADEIPYRTLVPNDLASSEIMKNFRAFDDWNWP